MRRLRRPKRKTLDSRLQMSGMTEREKQIPRFARNDRCGVSLAIFVSMTKSEEVGLRYANPTSSATSIEEGAVCFPCTL